MSRLVFQKYFKTIVTNPDVPSKYIQWIKLDEIEDSRPNGFFLRIPFYLYGANDANIVVSNKENPTESDYAYEIVFGGWQQGHIGIRKGINGPVLVSKYWPNILSAWQKKKFILEIQQNNYIRLYSEDFPYFPIAMAYDVIPENVKFNYLSVKNINDKPLTFSYGKPAAIVPEKVFMDLVTEKYGDVKIHPLFEQWKKFETFDLKCKFQFELLL